jgi:pyocin large subunit-like protein
MLSLAAILAALGVVACDRAADAPSRDHNAVESAAPVAERAEARADDPREAPVPKIDGKPMWSANRTSTAEENAQARFERYGADFGAKDVDDFVAMAHAFTSNPPKGTERIKRASNGDTLLYDPKGNVFAVVTKDGAPRTMFKPDNGAEYWEAQKTKESAAAKKAADRDEG